MPAAVWPCFHCRPSTTRTLLFASASMRQTPTTLRKDFGSAPTVSSAKSTLSGSIAPAFKIKAAIPTAASAMAVTRVALLIADLLLGTDIWECVGRGGSTTKRRQREVE